MYKYSAKLIKVVDGDTLHLDVDLGFDVRRKDSFRLAGINAPEMSTTEGIAARDWLVTLINEAILSGQPLTITTAKDRRERYGRYLATLWVNDLNVNLAAIEAGHAVKY